ncbi:MAG: OsmC family protein [Psychrosphaera sp.]|nr:OsmC family protein [Psychrosphaera sp.]
MKATVKWVDNMTFLGRSESGHNVIFDAGDENTAAPSPMEMVLMSAGCCSSVDVVSILKKARQKVSDCEVTVTGERADTVPKVFTKIHLHFDVTGVNVSEKHVERAVNLSADKYCSVALMLAKGLEVTHDFSVIEEAE